MSLAFAEHGATQRAIGNKIVDRPYQTPDGWSAKEAVLTTDYRDASGKAAWDTALLCIQAHGLDLAPVQCDRHTYVQMFKRTEELVDVLKKETVDGIRGIMQLGDKMSQSHLERFQKFEKLPPKQACMALDGGGLRAWGWDKETQAFADKHLRILSGLYGVLRPYDDVKPVRDIPMNARIKTKKGLYLQDFWGDSITRQVGKDLKDISAGNKSGAVLLVRCGVSDEYWNAVKTHTLPDSVSNVEISFQGAGEKEVARGRGEFAAFFLQKKVTSVEGLKDFRSQDWSLDEKRCTVQKIFYVYIGEDGDKKGKKDKKDKKDKDKGKDKGKDKDKEGKQKDRDRRDSDAESGDDRKSKKRKEARDFSDMSSEEDKHKSKKSKKDVRDFSDMSSEEVKKKPKKRKEDVRDFSDMSSDSGAKRKSKAKSSKDKKDRDRRRSDSRS
eukprot:TRINITY_DN12609_c0_g1_i1.p1 TRINITY_DN12609_c0_g1~~TRINITY_DN12609_c0_g1_i1.p1  ORF type:complete len:440 (+),score=89.05 TRINITY_DN12609_c0_g1_i1:75-1394(+)